MVYICLVSSSSVLLKAYCLPFAALISNSVFFTTAIGSSSYDSLFESMLVYYTLD